MTIIIALVDVEPDTNDDEFNQWYNEVHVPERMRCPGFLSATRYRALEGGPRYLAVYELDGPEALTTPQYLSLTRHSSLRYTGDDTGGDQELTVRMLRSMRIVARNVYQEIHVARSHVPRV